MSQTSAGLLMCRKNKSEIEFFLIHPGGPFYKNKDAGVWSIPKGLIDGEENLLDAARREFTEETAIIANGEFHSLGTIKLKSGKVVHAWTFLGDWDEATGIKSNTFPLEWPPKSKKFIQVPEADRGAWLTYEKALELISPAQQPLLERARKLYS